MKRGIEAYATYDKGNRWMLVIEKKRGKLTLEEIKEAAREYEWDYYLLVLDCYHDENEIQFNEDFLGDKVMLYKSNLLDEEHQADLFCEENEEYEDE